MSNSPRRITSGIGLLFVVTLAVFLAGYGTGSGPSVSSTPSPPYGSTPATTATGAPGHQRIEHGWLTTVYYTAVESFHKGHPEQVRGCPELECGRGDTDLGSYPRDFVNAVHDEGSGRITSGKHAGKYLNWSSNTGYWLDNVARSSEGRELVPFVTAAADGLPAGTHVRVNACGRTDDGSPPPLQVCHRLSHPFWLICDQFTPGLGGARHIDLYIGEEDRPGFKDSPLYTTLYDAVLQIQ